MQMKLWFLVCLIGVCLQQNSFAQQALLFGKVTDEEGSPIISATIRIADLTTGVATDTSGYFRLRLPENKELTVVFSHIGYSEKRFAFRLASGQSSN
jgi:hypothetical protein